MFKLMLTILGALAEMERELTVEWISDYNIGFLPEI